MPMRWEHSYVIRPGPEVLARFPDASFAAPQLWRLDATVDGVHPVSEAALKLRFLAEILETATQPDGPADEPWIRRRRDDASAFLGWAPPTLATFDQHFTLEHLDHVDHHFDTRALRTETLRAIQPAVEDDVRFSALLGFVEPYSLRETWGGLIEMRVKEEAMVLAALGTVVPKLLAAHADLIDVRGCRVNGVTEHFPSRGALDALAQTGGWSGPSAVDVRVERLDHAEPAVVECSFSITLRAEPGRRRPRMHRGSVRIYLSRSAAGWEATHAALVTRQETPL